MDPAGPRRGWINSRLKTGWPLAAFGAGMSIFEYLMVMVSIILALALAQLLRGIAEILTNPNRFWIHTAWVLVTVGLVIQFWWAYWDFSAVSSWTILMFMYVLSAPILLFLASYLLLPGYRSKDQNWREHFFEIRRWLFLTLIALSLAGTFETWSLLGVTLLHPYRVFQVVILAVVLIGFFSKDQKVQGLVVISYISVALISQFIVRMDIGALARVSS